jgi:glyoxylase-like metal-dependent hydrolase (beta-lactamase superfamily II)
MRTLITLIVVLLSSFVCTAQTQTQTQPQTQHHQQNPSDPFRLQKLSDTVYALYGRGGNIGFYVGPDSVFVIDSQFRDLAPGIVDKIKSVTDKPIKYLLNTHHHGDHVGGNQYFVKFSVILAHDNVRKRVLASPQEIIREYPALVDEARKAGNENRAKALEEQIEWAKKVKVEEVGAPFLTYNSELRLHLGDETIQVWHVPPAHTDGDSVAYFEKSNILHTGDMFFNKVFPFIDVKGGGSALGYLKSLDILISRVPPNVTVIPGHGDVTDLNGLKEFRQYIQDLNDAAQKAKAANKSKEEFVKTIELPRYSSWRGYADRFKDNAGVAYDEAR